MCRAVPMKLLHSLYNSHCIFLLSLLPLQGVLGRLEEPVTLTSEIPHFRSCSSNSTPLNGQSDLSFTPPKDDKSSQELTTFIQPMDSSTGARNLLEATWRQ